MLISATGTRTWVARVRAEYPNQLDYSGSVRLLDIDPFCIFEMVNKNISFLTTQVMFLNRMFVTRSRDNARNECRIIER